ncbi:MAG: hypothetical protein AABZ74_13180, partial [Cyanobacteriota bacterium]
NTIEGTITDKTGIDIASIPTSVQDGDKTISIVVKPKNDKEVNFTGIISNFDAEKLNDELERKLLESSVGGTMEDNVKDVFGNIAPEMEINFYGTNSNENITNEGFSTKKGVNNPLEPIKDAIGDVFNYIKDNLKDSVEPKTKEEQEKKEKEQKDNEREKDEKRNVSISINNTIGKQTLQVGKGSNNLRFYTRIVFKDPSAKNTLVNTITIDSAQLFISRLDKPKAGEVIFSSIKIFDESNISKTLDSTSSVFLNRAVWYGSIRNESQLRDLSKDDSKNPVFLGPPFASTGAYQVFLTLKGMKKNGKHLREYASKKKANGEIVQGKPYNEAKAYFNVSTSIPNIYNQKFNTQFNQKIPEIIIKPSNSIKAHIRERHDANFLTAFQFIRAYEIIKKDTVVDLGNNKQTGLIDIGGGVGNTRIYEFRKGEKNAKGSPFYIDHEIFLGKDRDVEPPIVKKDGYVESIANMTDANDFWDKGEIEGVRNGLIIRVSFDSTYSISTAFPKTKSGEGIELENYYFNKGLSNLINIFNKSSDYSKGKIESDIFNPKFIINFTTMGNRIKDTKKGKNVVLMAKDSDNKDSIFKEITKINPKLRIK